MSATNRPETLFIDIDGTLLRSDLSVSQRTREAVRRAELFAEVVLCSGRPLAACRKMASELLRKPAFVIASNGGVVYDCDNAQVTHTGLFDPALAREIAAVARAAEVALCVYHPTEWYVTEHDQAQLEVSRSGTVPTVLRSIDGVLDGAVKLMMVGTPAQIRRLDSAMAGRRFGVNLFTSYPEYLEIMPGGVDKGVAARRLTAVTGRAGRRSAAIGDGPADLALFDAVDVSVAVSNAPAEIRQDRKSVV